MSHRFCRIYVPKDATAEADFYCAKALDDLLGTGAGDDLTNM